MPNVDAAAGTKIDDLPSCEELLSRVMTEADETLKRLTG
jgi:hypothetical protein